MTSDASGSLVQHDAGSSDVESTIRWPLAYSLQLPQQQQGQQLLQVSGHGSSRPARKPWWSHKMYRGPYNKPVQILYSKTIEDSEKYARLFLEEDVVGFDMEWPWNDWKKTDLQNKIGLIQVASEDKIALFHIGLHVGKTVDQIMAPSLRKLIENPRIGKVGVGILNADFGRLHRFFHLNPKGAVELSHLYRLIKFGAGKPQLVSTKLVSLARLVEDQLGYPLFKGDVRTSNWSKPLSKDQIDYAASDAYAGYMLFHCMNYKRSQMTPAPPLPVHAETYLAFKLSGVVPLRLEGQDKDGSITTSEEFFGTTMNDQSRKSVKSTETKPKEKSLPTKKATPKKAKPKEGTPKKKTPSPKVTRELADVSSNTLYKNLAARRLNLAREAKVPAFHIATNAVLIELALERPTTTEELLGVRGIGKVKQQNYGDAWLEVITQFIASDQGEAVQSKDSVAQGVSTKEPLQAIETPQNGPSYVDERSVREGMESPESSAAFGTPPPLQTPLRPPQLHTGLSFSMADTKLDDGDDGNASCYSDDTLGSLDFGDTIEQTVPELKRKRSESFGKDEAMKDMNDTPQQRRFGESKMPAFSTSVRMADVVVPQACSQPARDDSPAPSLRIARSKLQAFSKLVTRKLGQRPVNAPPIVSERTLSLVIVRAPQTQEELERIPGIDMLILACQQTGTDLLKNVVKFTAPLSLDTGGYMDA